MGGKPDTSVKETSQQKAAAEVAHKQWELYKTQLRPYEDRFLRRTDKLNDESQYQKAAAISNISNQAAFSGSRQQTAGQLAAQGADPTSGKFTSALGGIADDQQLSQQDNTNRFQVSQADKYVAGLQDVSALGQGQKADALRGYQSLADSSVALAKANADAAMMRREGQLSLAGSLAGAATAGAMGYANGAFGGGGAAPGGTVYRGTLSRYAGNFGR